MAEPVGGPRELAPAAPRPKAPALPSARVVAGERLLARTLRSGALLSGGLFLASLVLELLPVTTTSSVLIDHLRKSAASVLLVTPVVRLALAGLSLGLRGEWRYALYAAGVLSLLGLAVGAGFAA